MTGAGLGVTDAAAVRARFDAAPMGAVQKTVIALTFALSALDGYDVLSVAFAAPSISAEWGITKATLGVVLSAGLLGMAAGALVLAPLADMIGRKTVVLICLCLMAVGMAASSYAGGTGSLAGWRVVTGLGIGGCVATINPIAAEFANARHRALTVSIMAIGYPAGGLAGGIVASVLLRFYDWRAVFFFGFSAAFLLLPLVAALMPESLGYLLTRPGPAALPRINAVLKLCGHPGVASLAPAGAVERRGYAALFGERPGATAWITVANLLYAAAAYYVLSWLPQMVADAGFSAASASVVSAIGSLAGIGGGLALGWLAQRHGLRGLTSATMIGLGGATMVFGWTPPVLPLLMLAGGICGMFLFSGATGVYATIATTFSDEARASGSGFVSGIGRLASAAAPLLAGFLFNGGMSRSGVSLIFGLVAVLSGLIILTGWQRFRTA